MSINRDQQIRDNQAKIAELAESIGLWLGTPNAQKPDVKAKILELQDRMLFRLQELEVEGQKAKIAEMTTVLEMLKTGKV